MFQTSHLELKIPEAWNAVNTAQSSNIIDCCLAECSYGWRSCVQLLMPQIPRVIFLGETKIVQMVFQREHRFITVKAIAKNGP